jgi:glycosyltransferase involved in cell wall biosynthesis
MYIVYAVAVISDVSGGTRVIIEHANRLAALGNRVELWTTNEGDGPYFSHDFPVKTIADDKLSDPDVVVMTDPSLINRVRTNRTQQKSYLLIQHDNEWVSEVTGSNTFTNAIQENIEYFNSKECEILVVSTWLQEVVRERYGLDALLIPNGVNEKLFHPAKPLIIAEDPSVLVMYDPQSWKGFPEAMQAILQVQQEIPNLQIVIVGRYFPEVPQVEGMSFGFPFPALYFNRPRQQDLASIYESATVFVSTSWKEGFGLPGLEAMACGTPVVCTDAGGNREYIEPGVNCLVVQPKDIANIADGISRLINDAELQKKLSQAGINTANRLHWESSILALEAEFKKSILQM